MVKSHRLTIADDMNIYHVGEQKQQLIDALAQHKALELDLSQVEQIDTAGLQLLILVKREALRLGKEIRITAHSQAVREIIDFCHLAVYFGDPVVITAGERR